MSKIHGRKSHGPVVPTLTRGSGGIRPTKLNPGKKASSSARPALRGDGDDDGGVGVGFPPKEGRRTEANSIIACGGGEEEGEGEGGGPTGGERERQGGTGRGGQFFGRDTFDWETSRATETEGEAREAVLGSGQDDGLAWCLSLLSRPRTKAASNFYYQEYDQCGHPRAGRRTCGAPVVTQVSVFDVRLRYRAVSSAFFCLAAPID